MPDAEGTVCCRFSAPGFLFLNVIFPDSVACAVSLPGEFPPEELQQQGYWRSAIPRFLFGQLDSSGSSFSLFFVKYFSLKKASEFPFFSKGFSLPSAGIMHPCA